MKKRILIALVVVLALAALASVVWADMNADGVVAFFSGPGNADANDPAKAVDEVDNTWVSLGTAGEIIVRFVDNVAIDGAGDDIRIRDRCGGIEEIEVLVSDDGVSFVSLGTFDDLDFTNRCTPLADAEADLDIDLGALGGPGFVTQVKVVDQSEPDIQPLPRWYGFDLEDIVALNSVEISTISLSATPASDVNPIGTAHTVQATLSHPIEGVMVTFAISGPNAGATGTAPTDSSGVATFTYTGSSPGTDSIVASVTFEGTTISAAAVEKTWYDKFVSGGGQLIEAPDGTKRPEWLVISFGGFAASAGATGYIGEWQVNFHNVGDSYNSYDKSTFHTTNIVAMNFYEDPSCGIAMNFTATGLWNGTPGYKMTFRAEDAGEPGINDNARIELSLGGTKVYDTHWFAEFTDESRCVGTARTGLDNGNLQMDVLP